MTGRRRPLTALQLRDNTPGLVGGVVPHEVTAFLVVVLMLYVNLVSRGFAVIEPITRGLFRSELPQFTALLLLIWLNVLVSGRRRSERTAVAVAFVGAWSLAFVVAGRVVATQTSASTATMMERYCLLMPLAAAAGFLVVRSGRARLYFSWLLVGGAIAAALAIVERGAGISVFGTRILVQNGSVRAAVGLEHPLVLAAVLVALIPIAFWLGGGLRYPLAILLYTGELMTDSEGPMVIGAVLLVVCGVPAVARLVVTRRWPLVVTYFVIFAALAYGALYVWSNQIAVRDVNESSSQNRAALYYLLPKILHDRPLGYGFGGLPLKKYTVATIGGGGRDIRVTIDSELILAATQIGLLALLAYVVIVGIGIAATARHQALALSSLAVTSVGFFLAIHSWKSLGSFWLFGIGACVAVLGAPRPADHWLGLFRRSPTTRFVWPTPVHQLPNRRVRENS